MDLNFQYICKLKVRHFFVISVKFVKLSLCIIAKEKIFKCRVSLSKVYGAVPPPQQLLEGVQSTSTGNVTISICLASNMVDLYCCYNAIPGN